MMSRRSFLELALALSATAAWGEAFGLPSTIPWREHRDLYPEGVASGDPDSNSVLLWTRRPPKDYVWVSKLHVEIAEDERFQRVVAKAEAPVSEASDWTCRVLVGGLKPARVYWYRFSDANGSGSRIGRTITAPSNDDPRPIRFAFVSCQNANLGAQNAYRRMIFEDERAPEQERLAFVLHLGDFIYEVVWYPEDRPQGMYDRRVRDIVRYEHGEKIQDFHIPTTVGDYRAIYRNYLHDPDLQDARARWPFVCMWDNHEYSWKGWQGLQRFGDKDRPAQSRKVAANQAFFEYQPARLHKPSGPSLATFDPPQVADAPIAHFDQNGLGVEPNNLAAINSLRGYRGLRWGRNLDLIITDQRSYRSEEPTYQAEAQSFLTDDFPGFMPEEVLEILDAGNAFDGNHPPEFIPYGDAKVPNFRRDRPPTTLLGAEQKAWFLDRLQSSKATWKVWADTVATLEMRADPQNLPAGLTVRWPGVGYAGFDASSGAGDHSTAYTERGEIYDFVRKKGIIGFATIAGDRHSFWASLAAKALPPKPFEPVGIAFVTASISAPGIVEALEHGIPKDHPLRALFVGQGPADKIPRPTFNLLLRHGVRACLEYAKSGDIKKARAASNPELSPHVSFVDMAAHGYAIVRATASEFETEFVCISRPLERAPGNDGGPVLYRVKHRSKLWGKEEHPELDQEVGEGDPRFSV